MEYSGNAHITFDWDKLSGCAPAAPVLSEPSPSTLLEWNAAPTFSWQSAAGATQYYVQLNGPSGSSASSGWISGTQWNIGGLMPGSYTWNVTARNEYGSSAPYATWAFSLVDPPPAPTNETYVVLLPLVSKLQAAGPGTAAILNCGREVYSPFH